jgi:hypothetical protein
MVQNAWPHISALIASGESSQQIGHPGGGSDGARVGIGDGSVVRRVLRLLGAWGVGRELLAREEPGAETAEALGISTPAATLIGVGRSMNFSMRTSVFQF